MIWKVPNLIWNWCKLYKSNMQPTRFDNTRGESRSERTRSVGITLLEFFWRTLNSKSHKSITYGAFQTILIPYTFACYWRTSGLSAVNSIPYRKSVHHMLPTFATDDHTSHLQTRKKKSYSFYLFQKKSKTTSCALFIFCKGGYKLPVVCLDFFYRNSFNLSTVREMDINIKTSLKASADFCGNGEGPHLSIG